MLQTREEQRVVALLHFHRAACDYEDGFDFGCICGIGLLYVGCDEDVSGVKVGCFDWEECGCC